MPVYAQIQNSNKSSPIDKKRDQNPNENSEKRAEQLKGIAEGVTLAGYSSNVSPNLQYQLEKLEQHITQSLLL